MENNCIGSANAVSTDGPTSIHLRSARHDTATAAAHYQDMVFTFNFQPFFKYTQSAEGQTKAVWLIRTDGGSDENIRFVKTLVHYILLFIKYKLDTLIVVMTAPHFSAFNESERTMAFINEWLNGQILDAFQFGVPIGSNGRTINKTMELFNFKQCGIDLANICNKKDIAGYPVNARYVSPKSDPFERDENLLLKLHPLFETLEEYEKWKLHHVRRTQYSLQIVSCLGKQCNNCSKSARSQYFDINKLSNNFPFLPTMVAVSHEDGQIIPNKPYKELSKEAHYASFSECLIYELPANQSHDAFNPQIDQQTASRRTCRHCGHYFVSIKENKLHQKLNLCGWKNEDIDINHHHNMQILHLFDKLTPSQSIENIHHILTYKVDKNGNNVFLVKYMNEDKEWVHLDDSLSKVKEFMTAYKLIEAEAKEDDDIIPQIDLHQIPEFLKLILMMIFIQMIQYEELCKVK